MNSCKGRILVAVTMLGSAVGLLLAKQSVSQPPPGSNPVVAAASVASRLAEDYGKLPLSFEANLGQSNSQVKFVSRGRGYTLFLTSTEAVLRLAQGRRGSSVLAQRSDLARYLAGRGDKTSAASAVLRMSLVGASPSPNVVGLDELPGKSNYLIGNDPRQWHTQVSNYARVEYRDVYPGVNLLYHGTQRQLEYDFIVRPGADPKLIALSFQGQDQLRLDAQGDLLLSSAAEEVRFHRPLVYQETDAGRQEIAARYVQLDENKIGFALGPYDGRRALVIDPVLSYSTYLGGSGSDLGLGIAVDSTGNAYVTGQTDSPNFPTASPAQGSNAGGLDVFVSKINAAGSALVYSTYLGGSGNENGAGIIVDCSGNAYLAGATSSTNFPVTAGSFQAAAGGGGDAFVTKLSATGTLAYSTYLGGGGFDAANSIAVDSSGNTYIAGFTFSTNFPTASPIQGTNQGGLDGFVTKLNAAGTALVYSTYLGGSGTDVANGIGLDSSNNAYVSGTTNSINFPTTVGAFQSANAGAFDAFVTKINAAGSQISYSTYLGGSGSDTAFGIAVDSSNSAYVTGITASSNFPAATPLQSAIGGTTDAFVTKLKPDGSGLVYSTYLGGSNVDLADSIQVDSTGNAYVSGQTNSADFPTANAVQAALGGGFDAFVSKINSGGSALVYSTYLGGVADEGDFFVALVLDSLGSAYVTGDTLSANYPTTNALQANLGGSSDAFVTKLMDDFGIAASPSNQTATAGQSATYTITVSPLNGSFGQSVALSCSAGVPPNAACSFAPSSVTPGTSPATSTLTISTGSSSGFMTPPSRGRSQGPTYALWVPIWGIALAGIGLTAGGPSKRRFASWLLLGLLLCLLVWTVACGNSGGKNKTPQGNYSITITGTAGTEHSTKVSLTVQ